jgi:hypothetical protein
MGQPPDAKFMAKKGVNLELNRFPPLGVYLTAAAEIIKAADLSADQSMHGRQAAGEKALEATFWRASLNDEWLADYVWNSVTSKEMADATWEGLHVISDISKKQVAAATADVLRAVGQFKRRRRVKKPSS